MNNQARPRATAGPLTVHKARNPNGLERSEDWAIMAEGQIIAECFGISGYRKDAPIYQHQPAEANARLFAAAPDLFEALTECHELLTIICLVLCKNNPPPHGIERIEKAAAALAKVNV